jgi:methionine-rich copper-binding protein CopC
MRAPRVFSRPAFAWGRSALLLAALWFAPAEVSAHAYLVKATPAQRAVVFVPPARVQLLFSERLEPKFCAVTVTDAKGKSVDNADLKVTEDNPKQLTIGLMPLPAGVYNVQFRVLSVDGHVVTNQFTFTVRERR